MTQTLWLTNLTAVPVTCSQETPSAQTLLPFVWRIIEKISAPLPNAKRQLEPLYALLTSTLGHLRQPMCLNGAIAEYEFSIDSRTGTK